MTILCAWCGSALAWLNDGHDMTSHGICATCAAVYFPQEPQEADTAEYVSADLGGEA